VKRARCRQVALSVALTLTTVACLVGVASPAFAGACGADGPTSRFLGWGNWGSPTYLIEGVSAVMTAEPANLCTGSVPFNLYSAWVMLANSDGKSGYAQAGFFRIAGGSQVAYAEWNQFGDGNYFRTYGSIVANGQSNRYWVQYDPASNWLWMNFETTRISHSGFPLFGAGATWTAPFAHEDLGEIKYLASTMPGTVAAPVVWSDLRIESYSNTWSSIPDPYLTRHAPNQDPTHWKTAAISPTSVKIWEQ